MLRIPSTRKDDYRKDDYLDIFVSVQYLEMYRKSTLRR